MRAKLAWRWTILLVALLLASCASGPNLPSSTAPAAPAAPRPPAPAPTAAPAAPAPPAAAATRAPAAAAPAPTTAPAASQPREGERPPDAPAVLDPGRMVIYNSSIAITVGDTQEAIESMGRIARAAGGYVMSLSSRWEGENQVATMVIRVLGQEHDPVMSLLRKLAIKVKSENIAARDVTEEFVDLEAQVHNLEATEEQYVALLGRAGSIDEVMRVQQKVSEVRGQIDRLRGRLNLLRNQSDLATITVEVRPEVMIQPTPTPTPTPAPTATPTATPTPTVWNPLIGAERSWNRSLSFLERIADLIIVVVVFLWWALPLTLLTFVALRAWRARR